MRHLIAVIVDDEKNLSAELRLLLKKHTNIFEVIKIYTDGNGVIENLENDKADIYFIDVRLPGIPGYELPNIIYERTGKYPNVVFITGEATQQSIDYIYNSNCVIIDFLLRGFNKKRLELTEIRAQKLIP